MVEIFEIKIADLKPYLKNTKKHPKDQINKICKSIKEFGFNVPIIVDKDFEIIAGHGRLLAAQQLKLETIPAIQKTDLTNEQIKAYRIADNKTAESEWDIDFLVEELKELEIGNYDLTNTGFSADEINSLLGNDEATEDDFDTGADEVETDIVEGDIIQLGNHRLMCGDSTDYAVVSKLMNDTKADMCFTDPPYNINYGNIKHEKFKQREIKNDNMCKEDFNLFCRKFVEVIKICCSGCVYICGPPGPDGRIMFTAADNILYCSTTIIWNKDQFTLGRGKYQNKYEPIWFGWVDNGSRFTNIRTLTNVWDIKRPQKSDLHPTMKPIELCSKGIEHSTLKNDLVLDLFGGSGSTLIACEQLNRKCYMMELDPKYCEVICQRWEKLTGKERVMINGSKT